MANISIINNLPNCAAKNISSRKVLHQNYIIRQRAIAFMKNALFVDVIPKFAIVKKTIHQ